jgi:hypothetical protein
MAIGVFIAPILLYWEALSSLGPAMASIPCFSPASLDPTVAPAFPVRRSDEKRVLTHLENLVAVGRSLRNPTERITKVSIEQGATLHRPATGKSGYGGSFLLNLATKGAVGAERISAALHLICVKPIADERGSALPIERRAASEQSNQYQGQNRFHG